MKHLFKPLPADLSTLTDAELQELSGEHVTTFAAIRGNDPDTLGDRNAQQILDETKAGKDAYAAIKAEQQARADAEATYASEIDTLTSDIPELDAADGDADGEAAEGESAEAVESAELAADTESADSATADAQLEAEPVTAAVRRPLPQTRRHAAAPVEVEVDPRQVQLVAAAGVAGYDGFAIGDPLTEDRMHDALCAAVNNWSGNRQVFASARWIDKIPGERRLAKDTGGAENTAKIRASAEMATIETASLVAAGGQGNCAPLEPYYQLQVISTQARPARDALVGFGADRGGITYMPPPSLASVTGNGAVGSISSAAQSEGGTFATKTCAIIECEDIVQVQVNQVYKCLQFGNLQSRAYPEFVAQQNQLAMAEWARFADGLLLDQIKAGSVQVTGQEVAAQGAVNNYLGDLFQAAAGIRSNNRMPIGAPLQAMAPAWVRDLLVLDIARGQFDRFERAQAQIDDLLARYGINMAWTLDEPSTGVNQVFPVQTAGQLNLFPGTVDTAIFPPGTWLFLDSGTLDLGIVRDSTLNAINAYQLFAETFEIAAKVGVVSYWLTSVICPNGAVALPKDSSSYCS